MKEKSTEDTLELGDIGGFDLPDLDLDLFDTPASNNLFPDRYLKPRAESIDTRLITYNNAVKLARDLRLEKGQRADCLVGGSFVFGDFIEAYLTEHLAVCPKMTIATLSLSKDNVDSLAELMRTGYIDRLDLVTSLYFYSHEARGIVPYLYERLDKETGGDRFQLAVAAVHAKVVTFRTEGGRKVVIHGSANLRSSGNVEQFCIEENPALHDFYDERFAALVERCKTINHKVSRAQTWDTVTSKHFND